MGLTQSDITQAEFAKTWKISEVVEGLTVWENKDDPTHQLEEYSVQDYNQPATHTLYKLRKASPYLVNAYSLQKDGFTFCETGHEATKVFIEKIPLRLSNIKDVPYPDILHLYDTCINGFSLLADTVGFFAVDEQFIGVNEQGQARVWLNSAFESSSVLGRRDITEGHMLEGILELLHNATDHESFPQNVPSLSDHLGIANSQTTFDTIRQRFVDFVRQHNNRTIPLILGCVHDVGGPHQVKDWCRNNNSFGFDQRSLRLSEKFYQSKQLSRTSLQVKQQPVQNEIAQPQFYSQYQPAYFNPQNQSSIFTPQFRSIQWEPSKQEEASIRRIASLQSNKPISNPIVQKPIISNPIQSYSVASPIQVQTSPIYSNLTTSAPPQFAPYTPSLAAPINAPIFQQPIIKQLSRDPTRQSQLKLQQQRVISQTIEVKDSSRVEQAGFNNEVINPKSQNYIATPINSNSKLEIQSKYYNPTNQNQNKKNLQIRIPQTRPINASDKEADGKSSPQFLALLSSLKNPKDKVDFTEVYSQVADTPSSYYAKEGSSVSSGKKYFNHTNVHETYSQDAFSSFGQDSNKNIGVTATNNFTGQLEEDNEADKYSGRYNFSKYERAIDPELLADLQRYN